MPLLYSLVWFAALYMRREKQFISQSLELIIFFGSLVFSIKFLGHNSYYKLLAMGNALFVLQAMRLLWPLNRRDRRMAVMIAVTHLAVGSQFIVDYSFLIILLASIVLIPKALYSVEAEDIQGVAPPRTFGRGAMVYPVIAILMIIFFLLFPRTKFISAKETGMIISEGAMQANMDTVRGGSPLSSHEILRIKGDHIEYLKSFALDSFDGKFWRASMLSSRLVRTFSTKNLNKYKHRMVRVMDLTYLGSALPTDGYVINLKGNFFQGGIGVSEQGNVGVSLLWPQRINKYEYWCDFDRKVKLSEKELAKYKKYPAQSIKLQQWLNNIIKNERDPRKIGNLLEAEFLRNFKYRLGSPDLNKAAPVEDFIFNQKEGHCERYASALALLLRMKSIPSRVVVGYHVPPPNRFADFYSVQAKDAHAWVEAYIPSEEKWVIFDGTPAGRDSGGDKNNGIAYTIRDWIEYVWYSKIVEFSPDDQKGLLDGVKSAVNSLFPLLKQNAGWATTLLLTILVVAFGYKLRDILPSIKIGRQNRGVKRQVDIAESFYRDLLTALAKINIYRPGNLTPYEFLEYINTKNLPIIDEVKLITDCFCTVKYAEKQLTSKQMNDAELALKKLHSFCSGKITSPQ